MKTRRAVAVIAALVVTTVAFTGCSGTSPKSSTKTGALTFVADKPWNFKSFSKVSENDIGVSLKPTRYSDAQAYEAFVKQSFRTNQSPGLFTWQVGGGLKDLVDQGVLADTSSIWKDAVAKGYVADSVRDLYTVNGKQYCVPISVDDWVMFYNKKIFAKYNLAVPTTWDQLMQDAATLKKDGVTPFWNQTSTWSFVWFQTLLAGTDLDLYKKLSTGKASYTDPKVVAIMNEWLAMQKQGYFNDPGQKDFTENLMRDGKIAMAPFGTFWTANAAQAGMKIGTDYGAFTIPAITQSGSTPVAVESAPACVANSSSQKALGLKYSAWWMSPQGQTAWVAQQGNLPYNPKATAPSSSTIKALSKEFDSGKYTFYERYYEATPTPIRTVALDQFSAFLVNRGDPMQYLKIIQAAAKSYWAGQ